jgi:hypothetical protein
MAARRAAGEKTVQLSPLEKAAKNPSSLRMAVNAKCYDCQGRDCDPGIRQRIGTCSVTRCPLWSVRPYQRADQSDDHAELEAA